MHNYLCEVTMKKLCSALFFVALSAGNLQAQPIDWKLDKAHSNVTFAVTHMVISEVTGTFRDYEISVRTSQDDFSDASIQAVINVASIDTDNERRDGHLKSDDFFSAEKFPEIRFTSKSIEKIDEKNYKIHGDLTIRDITKPVTFDAVFNGRLKMGKAERVGWKATLTIDRFDFGLQWDRTIEAGGLVVGKEVKITVNLELTREIAS